MDQEPAPRIQSPQATKSPLEAGLTLPVRPEPDHPKASVAVDGIDQDGNPVTTDVVTESALTLFLNGQEIVTLMTIGTRPEALAVGYLLNQNMLRSDDKLTAIDFAEDIATIVVRTERKTDFEEKLKKKTQTSGCAQGTVFGDLMEAFDEVTLSKAATLRTSWLYALAKKINTTPSLYLKAGAIHGCVLCERDQPLLFIEDVGRHNAVDTIAGLMFLNGIKAEDKIFYSTGRLTSEMVIKTVKMGLPILVSRSGFTAWGVELARQVDQTLIGRARGRRFIALAGQERIVFDAGHSDAPPDDPKQTRKDAVDAAQRPATRSQPGDRP